MPAVTSSIPAAVDALLAIIAGLAAFDGVQQVDGWAGPNQEHDLVAVAYGDEAARGNQSSRYAGSARRTETNDIACVISCWVGGYANAEQKAARDRAFTLLAALEQAIRPVQGSAAGARLPDAEGGPTVLYGQITDVEYRATGNENAPGGRWAEVLFTIRTVKIL